MSENENPTEQVSPVPDESRVGVPEAAAPAPAPDVVSEPPAAAAEPEPEKVQCPVCQHEFVAGDPIL